MTTHTHVRVYVCIRVRSNTPSPLTYFHMIFTCEFLKITMDVRHEYLTKCDIVDTHDLT